MSNKSPDPGGLMIWGYGEVNDPVSDFKGFFTRAGKSVEFEYHPERYESHSQEVSRRIEIIRGYVYADQETVKAPAMATGGAIVKKTRLPHNERVLIAVAIGTLSVAKYAYNKHQVGYTSIVELINNLSAHPTDIGYLNLAILNLQVYYDNKGGKIGDALEVLKDTIAGLKNMVEKYKEPVKEERFGRGDVVRDIDGQRGQFLSYDPKEQQGPARFPGGAVEVKYSKEFGDKNGVYIEPANDIELIKSAKMERGGKPESNIVKEQLCICNNCGTIYVDENPSDQPEIEVISGEYPNLPKIKDSETGEMIWGCDKCGTDGYLADVTDYKELIKKHEAGGNTGIARDRKFQSQQPWEQAYDRKKEPRHPHYHKSAFEKGGAIIMGKGIMPMKYDLAPAKNIWKQWNFDQRTHFLEDHNSNAGIVDNVNLTNNDFDDLPVEVRVLIQRHIKQGRYEQGGAISEGENLDIFGYQSQHFDISPGVVKGFKEAIEKIDLDKEEESAYYKSMQQHLADFARQVDIVLEMEKKAVQRNEQLTEEDFNKLLEAMGQAAIYNHKSGEHINITETVVPHFNTISGFKNNAPGTDVDLAEYRGADYGEDNEPVSNEQAMFNEVAGEVAHHFIVMEHPDPSPEQIEAAPEETQKLINHLLDKAGTSYVKNAFFKRMVDQGGDVGRNMLQKFMTKWARHYDYAKKAG